MRPMILGIFSLLLLISCAPAPGNKPTAESDAEATKMTSDEELRQLWAQVAGVVVEEGEPLRISYPTGVLFAASAVLPMPGGVSQLDSLVQNIKTSGRNWRLLVRGQSGEGADYDQILAAARLKVLRTYLDGAGLNQKQAQLAVANNPGAPLELQLAK